MTERFIKYRQLPTESDIPMHGWAPYHELHQERIRAHTKHSPTGHSMEWTRWDDPIWLAVLGEEFGEVAREVCEHRFHGSRDEYRSKLRGELVQVGAMVAAWIDALDDMEAP